LGVIGLLLALAILPAAAAPPEPTPYDAEIAGFRARRDARLRSDNGWLTLVGLSWLELGDNPVGSAPKSRVLLSSGKAPANLGTIRLQNGAATFVAASGAAVTSDGKPVASLAMKPDTSGTPTVLAHGSLSFYLIKRGARLGVRVKDKEAKTLKEFKGVPNFAVNPLWRLVARFEPYDPPRKIDVPNILGSTEADESPGAVVFEVKGEKFRLEAVKEDDSGELFLIFGDRTNGTETYGGGRFLYTAPPKDGTVVVDFNQAINPPCVFTPYATCPLPPAPNRLPIRIPAGEKAYGKH
jgi:uncharacterized protein (DUF1684 family)